MKQRFSVIGWIRKLLAEALPRRREIRTQRVCPFCRLITSTRAMSCLECGKLLKPA